MVSFPDFQSYIPDFDYTSTNTLIIAAIVILTIFLIYKVITNLVYIVAIGALLYFLIRNYNRNIMDL